MFGLYRFSIYTVGVGWLFIFVSGFLVVTFHQINVQLPRFLFVYWLPRGSWGLEKKIEMSNKFIENLNRRRSEYANPEQATTQAYSLNQLSSGIYTEEERFVFELLQNAVDAYNVEDGCLDVKIQIKEGFLVFMHNGAAFSERDVEGLCDVGNGNKANDVKKIGYKGIGFKAVFMRSTCVTVESGEFCFKFDKEAWEDYWDRPGNWLDSYGEKRTDREYLMPWQIIPIETTPPLNINRDGYNVVTYIRITEEEKFVGMVRNLMKKSQFLLFLRCHDIQMSFVYQGMVERCLSKTHVDDVVVLSANGKEETRWLMYTNEDVPVPRELRDKISLDVNTPLKLKRAESFDLSFAIAIDKKKNLKKIDADSAVMYTYLPTSFKFGGTGFPFLVNANFITDAGRLQLFHDSEWNKLIFSKIPSEFLSWMSQLTDKYGNYYEVLPKMSYGNANPLQVAYEKSMREAVDSIAFIPREKNAEQKVLSRLAIMDSVGVSKAISKKKFVEHINKVYDRGVSVECFIQNVPQGRSILQDYGVFVFGENKLKALFDDEEAFEGITPALEVKLVELLFLLSEKQRELTEILRDTRFLMTTDGELFEPYQLFFPSSYKERNEMAKDAHVLHDCVADLLQENVEMKKWFERLGVAKLSDVTFIKKVMCKDGYVTTDNVIEVGRFLFDTSKKEVDIFDEIGYENLVNLRFLSKARTLEKASELFIARPYQDINIEELYSEKSIYVSEEYVREKDDPLEWMLFFKKMGMICSLEMTQIVIGKIQGGFTSGTYHVGRYFLLADMENEFKKCYNQGSWSKFYYCFDFFELTYPPLIFTQKCSLDFQKMIWKSVLSRELPQSRDIVHGHAGFWPALRTFRDLGYHESFLSWMLKNEQHFPATNGKCMLSSKLFLNTEEIKKIAGKYLPVIDVDCEIHKSWLGLLSLRNSLGFADYLDLLTNIAEDEENARDNKERICKVYDRLVELDVLSSDRKKKEIKDWAKNNRILSKGGRFVDPEELYYITLDGFEAKEQVYIGNVREKEKVVELLELMGVSVITEDKLEIERIGEKEEGKLKYSLLARVAALTLLKMEKEFSEEDYKKAIKGVRVRVGELTFYQCQEISLSYGNEEDKMGRSSFGVENNFYYTGDIRPANLDSLLEPLCKFLGIPGKERELWVLLCEDEDGIQMFLQDKGYDTTWLKKYLEIEKNVDKIFDSEIGIDSRSSQQILQDQETGFKGEIFVYEYLKKKGYEPDCQVIATKDDGERVVVWRGKKYYCKDNFGKYDISFKDENGRMVFVEVKTTVTPKGSLANMPISSREWSMIDECERRKNEVYLIARVFDIDSSSPDIYFLEGHKAE